ncbi:tripartite motif-containing protein 28 [Mytilus galloprovincialis]|uniref:Tripartite motif-containing protein 28 n=1 Tax=Mytilus galloprovincialis TaxID=29158 RepID=A0A8B6E367_MYTGA|nr:tripartite motif-containing protein 28 [Mytilus galloprovincialis]
MSDLILCGPCGNEDNNRNAVKWCTVCEEGLCTNCEKVHQSIKTTKNHSVIPTEDYRQIKNISVSLKCKDHDKRLELYCKTHDVAVCLDCVPSQHRTCIDVIPLDKAAENAKHSTALADLEDTLSRSLKNLQQIISDRDSALEKLDDQRQTIKNEINDTRERIIKKIEDLEQKLLLELDRQHGHCKSEVSNLQKRLKSSERDLCCLREQTSQLKSFASDIQLFLGTRQIKGTVFKEVESVKEGIKSVENSEINLQFHPYVMALLNEVEPLGEISVKNTKNSLPFKEANVDQAQVQRQDPEMKGIESVRIQLKKRFAVKQKGFLTFELTGCAMLTNGNLLMANYHGNTILMEYSEDGNRVRDIPCSRPPFDLTIIETNYIAVSYGSRKYIEILNLENNTVERKVKFENDCYGISYQDSKLVVITGGIVIIDIEGKVLKTFYFDCGIYLETTKDRIYFTTKKGHTVNCISMAGKEIWVHKDESLVKPHGIAVDDHQNVFVVDPKSKSLTVIQPDGKFSKTLITKAIELNLASSLHFNKEKQVLILCTELGYAVLYDFY